MKLENQVVSLELAKKLKELGFEQNSLFGWYCNGESPHHIVYNEDEIILKNYVLYSAYTVSELGNFIGNKKIPDTHTMPKEFIPEGEGVEFIFSANYWAKMLIYLKENNLI